MYFHHGLLFIFPSSINKVKCFLLFYKSIHLLTSFNWQFLKVIKDILSQTGITATAGIAPNLFLCKIAMDIVAKHVEADEDGVRIASLSVKEYRQKLWNYTPITDFWRIGNGTANRLSKHLNKPIRLDQRLNAH